jgi:ADP-heptose:LPS heptosyltransferase
MKNFLRRLVFDFLGRRRENSLWRIGLDAIDVRSSASLVLLNLDGKLGDAILQSSLVRAVSAAAPGCEITVVTTDRLVAYWQACAGVTRVYTVPSRSGASLMIRLRALWRLSKDPHLREAQILLSFDPIPMVDYFAFVRWCRPRAAVGLSATQYSIFHISISDPILETPKRHVGYRIVRTLAALGVVVEPDELRVILPSTLQRLRPRRVPGTFAHLFLNGFGAATTRTFSIAQLNAVVRGLLAKHPALKIVINADKHQSIATEIGALCAEFLGQVELYATDGGLSELFEAIAAADVVLTPDTGISHVAAATETPTVVVFDDCNFNPVCWRPLTRRAILMIPQAVGPISRFSAAELIRCVEQASAM